MEAVVLTQRKRIRTQRRRPESAQKRVSTSEWTDIRTPPRPARPSRLEEVDSARAGADLRTRGYENQHGAPTEVSKSDLLASRLCVRVVKGADLEPEGRGFESRRDSFVSGS